MMRIVSKESRCFVLCSDGRAAQCLHELALRCGFRVGELSSALGHSERYVQEVFVRDVGVAPKQWLRGERMAVAARLLGEGLRPWEVAKLVGFSAGAGFRREFRLMFGISPTRYVTHSAVYEKWIEPVKERSI